MCVGNICKLKNVVCENHLLSILRCMCICTVRREYAEWGFRASYAERDGRGHYIYGTYGWLFTYHLLLNRRLLGGNTWLNVFATICNTKRT